MSPHVRRLVGWSFCHNFLRGSYTFMLLLERMLLMERLFTNHQYHHPFCIYLGRPHLAMKTKIAANDIRLGMHNLEFWFLWYSQENVNQVEPPKVPKCTNRCAGNATVMDQLEFEHFECKLCFRKESGMNLLDSMKPEPGYLGVDEKFWIKKEQETKIKLARNAKEEAERWVIVLYIDVFMGDLVQGQGGWREVSRLYIKGVNCWL